MPLADTPPLARLDAWRSRVHYTHRTGARPFVAGPERISAGQPNAGALNIDAEGTEHYDSIHCIHNVAAYCARTDLPPLEWDVELAAQLVRYRDRWVLGGKAKGDGPPQWHHDYPTGLAEHYRATGDPLSLEAVDWLIPITGKFALDGLNVARHATLYEGMANTRPAAFQLLAMLDREWCGLGAHPLADSTAAVLLGHCAQWTAPPGTYFGVWCKPFMTGIALRALISYWDRYRDATEPARAALVARIPAAVLATCDHLWTDCRGASGAIVYQQPASVAIPSLIGLTIEAVVKAGTTFRGPASLSTVDDFYRYSSVRLADGSGFGVVGYVGADREFKLNTYYGAAKLVQGGGFSVVANVEANQVPTPSPVLNPMVAPAFAWAAWYSRHVMGDDQAAELHLARHDALFDGQAMAVGNLAAPKQWNQVMWWSIAGLDWRERTIAEWPDATAFALEAPATGAAGPHTAASGPFRLSIPHGVRLAGPAHVTLACSTGRGVFCPPEAILTTDRNDALFVFCADPLDDATTVEITATATGLAAPAAVAYAVGVQSPPPQPPTPLPPVSEPGLLDRPRAFITTIPASATPTKFRTDVARDGSVRARIVK